MRIALSHVSAWPEVRRGAERYVHELAATLAELGHDVVLLTTGPEAGSDLVLGVPVRRMGRGPLPAAGRPATRRQLQWAAWSLASAVHGRVDVWHANSLYDGAAAGLAGTVHPGLRTVFTAHGPAHVERLRRPPARQAAALLRRCDATVCVSAPAADEYRQATGTDSVVVPPGVDTRVFTPGGRRHDVPAVLHVGTLRSPRKGAARVVAAAAALSAEVPGLELWLAGDGDVAPLVRDVPGTLVVRALGVLEGEALVDAYRRAWVTALLSEREVFGMVVVESMACATPALVLSGGWGPASVVRPGTGVVADADDVVAGLRAALELAQQAGTAERCREVGRAHDWHDVVVPRLLEVYAGA